MALKVKALVVGGGGGYGGGQSGVYYSAGGGGAEVLYNADYSVSPQTYNITVGAGGSSTADGNGGQGSSSIFDTITARGGYGGYIPSHGGSSGSGSYSGGSYHVSSGAAGGGAGAGANGSNGTSGQGGAGGSGVAYSISGSSVYYGGGGGGRYPGASGADGAGYLIGGGGRSDRGGATKGIVIISWVTADFGTCSITGTSNTITTNGSESIATFVNTGTLVVRSIPTVTTQAVSSITATTATGNGNVTSDGGSTITERGICWKTSTGPTTSDNKVTASGTTGAFTGAITGLTQSTTYYVRAYATNTNGTAYGEEVTFTTYGSPIVTTQAVSTIDLFSGVGNGNVTSDNGYVISERGFCYKTSTGPTISDSKVVVSGTTGAYSGTMSGLSSGTLYYVRAYATNAIGTSYGAEVTFTTLTLDNKRLIKDISGVEGQTYAVSLNVGGSAGSVTVSLGTTGYSQVINAGAGVTVVQGTYSGLSGLIIEQSVGFVGTVDNVMYVLVLEGAVIDWSANQVVTYVPITSSVTFKRIEDKELTRFDLYRYLDAEFKDLDGYVTLSITEEANDISQTRTKTFIVGNTSGTVSPFVKKRISMLSKNQALVVGFSNAKLNETFTICQYQLTGTKEPRKLYKVSKIISI